MSSESQTKTYPTPFYSQDLDQGRCSNPECPGGHAIVAHAKCHPEAAFTVAYNKETRCLELYCFECGRTVMVVKVAEAVIQ